MEMNEKFKVSINWISDNYLKANNELFNNKLGNCYFNIVPIGERTLGRFRLVPGYGRKIYIDGYTHRLYSIDDFWGDKEWVDRDNFFELCNPTIEFNSNYIATYDALYNTLVHEMCHYYTYMNGSAPKQGHGPEFRNIANIVSYRSNGQINIKRLANKDEMTNYELDADLRKRQENRINNKKNNARYFIILCKDGSVRLTNIKNEDLIKKVVDFEQKRGYEIFEITDPYITEKLYDMGFKRQFRVYKFWALNPNSEITKEILNTPNKKQINENLNKMVSDIEITSDMDLSNQSPLEINLTEKAVSKSQQRFFGMVDAYKKGELDGDEVSKSVKDAANGMTMKQVKNFAKTKHKGLPNHINENQLRKIIRETLNKLFLEGDGNDPYFSQKHDMEDRKVEDRGNMIWSKSLK
jgi:predicted SprT family Zn-dependent metalloprotease